MIATIDDRTTDEILAVSFHEAAHAVAALVLGAGVKTATVRATDDTWGHVLTRQPPMSEVAAIAVKMAGPVADLRTDGQRHISDSWQTKDWQDVFRLLRADYATDDALLDSPEVREGILLAHKIVCQQWPAIRAIARALRKRNTLSGHEVTKIFRSHKKRSSVNA